MPSSSLRAPFLRGLRAYSIQAQAQLPRSSTGTGSSTPAWSLARNSRGSLPVYTDVRHNGAQQRVLIRNVDGDAKALARELKTSLFPSTSPDGQRLRIEIQRDRHLVIAGSSCKHKVMEWLASRGF